MKNDYYVYEWYNVNTNEVFYVGKGRKNRYKIISQKNKFFKDYYNIHNCDVRKVKTNLSEDEANTLKKELIEDYRNDNQCSTNVTYKNGSWYDLFRKLKCAYDNDEIYIKGNEEQYCPENLKRKSLEELEELYEEYLDAVDGVSTFYSLLYEDGWEHVWDD